jgi:hypothetical protein
MLGPKKLSEIKQELQTVLKKNGRALESWLDEQVSQRPSQSKDDARTLADLIWVRDLLRESLINKKPLDGKSPKPRRKKTPAA